MSQTQKAPRELYEISARSGVDAGTVRSMGRIAVTVILFGLLARAQTTFDLSADFSLRDNPNKVWQYGYSATNSLAPDQFQFDKYCDGGSPIGFWHPDASKGPGPGYRSEERRVGKER